MGGRLGDLWDNWNQWKLLSWSSAATGEPSSKLFCLEIYKTIFPLALISGNLQRTVHGLIEDFIQFSDF